MSGSALTLAAPMEDVLPRRGWYGWLKRPADVLLAVVGLVLGAPLMVITAVLVKLTSTGPVFYSQVRLGRGGRPFRIYKMRSMFEDSEALTGPCWSTKGDPRVTPIGRFLRRTHLDELPQLWNILKGDMSLIGPRPERPEIVAGLEKVLSRYRQRLLVRPGLTGLAQVQLPPDTDLQSVRVKLAHDLYYLERLGFWLDFRLLLATCGVVCHVPYRVIRSLLALPGGKAVEQRYEQESDDAIVIPDLQLV